MAIWEQYSFRGGSCMINFNEYFNDEYQFTLKKATYSWIETKPEGIELDLNISDTISATVNANQLEVEFNRNVSFNPEALYVIDVSFAFTLTFRDDVVPEECKNIDWSKVFSESEKNPYLGNVVSRASSLIAALTSSYGQQPLITPPNIIR